MSPMDNREKNVEIDEAFRALASNISAVLAVASSVEGTLGPKGLDTMLVDRFGDMLVTNSGVTILERMEISHPAARMLLQVAKAQHEHIGDGTTTATVMASAILKEGLNQISRGVPVSRLLEGIRSACFMALEIMQKECSFFVKGVEDPLLLQVAFVAGRGDEKMARLIQNAALVLGEARLKSTEFRFSDIVVGKEGIEDTLVEGVVLSKRRVSSSMPRFVAPAKILILDDSLLPEEVEEEALRTEAGFKKSLEFRSQFLESLRKIFSLGVNAIFLSGGLDGEAEELAEHSGIMIVRRLTSSELELVRVCSGAKPLKRSALRRDAGWLAEHLGKANEIMEDEGSGMIFLKGGAGKPYATLLIGASTRHVSQEKERKAKDAASAFQAALRFGVVPGGGACELAVARRLEAQRSGFKAMTSYGLDCVLQGLRQPFLQMCINAGFNALEKAEEVLSAQIHKKKDSISIDFETGKLADMAQLGIWDPLEVKMHALRSACETAEAILRINRIIKMHDNGVVHHGEKT
jgi:chaperonin GroEL (HSP60 family)